jgi:hypothetical protein
MENNNAEESELFKFFRDKSEGVGYTFDQLYKVCTTYADNFELSRDLSRLVKLKLIEKREKHYFYVDPTEEIKKFLRTHPDAIPESKLAEEPPPAEAVKEPAPARVIRVIPKAPVPVAKEEPPAPVEPVFPWGTLTRGSAIVAIGMTFYYNQKEAFTTADLYERTGVNKQVASQAVRRLFEGEYIVRVDGGPRSTSYRWSGKFRYPFPETRPEDMNWKKTRIERIPPSPEPAPAKVEAVAPAANQVNFGERPFAYTPPPGYVPFVVDPHLMALDAVIQRYESELAALRVAREMYTHKVANAA